MAYWSDHRAWISSCLFHTVVFLIIALLYRPSSKGTDGQLDRPAGIALVRETGDGSDFYLAGGSTSGTKASENAQRLEQIAASNVATPGVTSLEELVADLLPSSSDGSDRPSASEGSGNGLAGTGAGNRSGAGPGDGKRNDVATEFLGVRGTGSSFVYVLDRSDSMNARQSSPLLVATRELMDSIDSLTENNQFQIVFYNDAPNALTGSKGGKNRLLYADKAEKRRADQYVRGIVANGGTEHIPALRLGLSYGPDVLFFMTDGDLPGISEVDLADVRDRAARAGTTIHTIQFRPGPQERDGGWIRALAEQNRGVYRYVDIDELIAEPAEDATGP